MKINFYKNTLFIILLLNLPPAIQRLFVLDSSVFGFILVLMISLYLFNGKVSYKYIINNNIFIWILLAYSLLILIARQFYFEVDMTKYWMSIIVFITMIFSIEFYLRSYEELSNYEVKKLLDFVILFYVINGIFGILKVDLFNDGILWKSMGFFKEPSHFAVTYSPFLVTWFLISKNYIYKAIVFILTVTVIFYIESLTLLVCIGMLMAIIFFRFNHIYKISILIILLGVCILIFDYDKINFEYFLSRIPIISEPSHSNLYYYQSIEELLINLKNSYFMGISFQQLGVVEPAGDTAREIYNISGTYVTRYDGAAAFFKIASEFGLLGILFSAYIVYRAIKSFITLAGKKINYFYDSNITFAYVIIYSSLIYIFIKSSGYFSSMLFLLIFAIKYINYIKSK